MKSLFGSQRAQFARPIFSARLSFLRLALLTAFATLTSAQVVADTTLSATSSGAPGTVDLSAEGSTDWVHWAFDATGDVNRKVGGGAVIGNFSTAGGASPRRKTTASGYVWTDGAPLESVGSPRRKGLRNNVVGGSYALSIPASADVSTFVLFVGARNIDGTLSASLSDGSVAPVNLSVSAGGSRITERVEIVFASDAPGTTLEVSYTLDAQTASGPEQFLEAAALQGGGAPANQPPVLDAIADVTLTEGDALTLVLSAADPDDPTGLEFSEINTLPGSAAGLTDNGDGTGTITWDSSLGDAQNSPYFVDVVVSDPSGAEDTQQVVITVQEEVTGGGDGSLSGSVANAPSNQDLTALGTTDWAHWGFSSAAPYITKSGGSGDISDLQPIGNSRVLQFTRVATRYSWSDGDPVGSATNTKTGFRVRRAGEGMVFSVAADTNERELVVHIGSRRTIGRITAALSDNSAPPVIIDVGVGSGTGKKGFSVTLNYAAASAAATLDVSYELVEITGSGAAWINLDAATLTTSSGFALPFSDDFSSGADDWMVVDEATGPSSNWVTQNNRYRQQNFMGFGANATQGAAQVGTLSYLSGATNLSDYQFKVMVQPNVGATQGFSQDIGALVRYNPNTGDQVRLSFSGANAFGRLEQRINGVTSTLSQNSIGFTSTAQRDLEISVQGPVIVARLNGEKLFAAFDAATTQGTVGLYCRNACSFDDVEINDLPQTPEVFIAAPAASYVYTDATFTVSAVVLNSAAGNTVEFDIPGETSPCGPAVETAPALFEASCTVSGNGVYVVKATLRDDQDVVLDTDSRSNVGVGDSYIALGNSITAGLDDSTAEDAVSANGLVVGTQGFGALLSDRLTTQNKPVLVSNNGVPGDTSADIAEDRIAGVLQRHSDASHLLLTVGVNDAGGGSFLPSGLGCAGAACNGTFKGYVQDIVDTTNAAGVEPIISLAPPRFGDPFQTPFAAPETHVRNLLIRDEYNVVIADELSNATLGPDFFDLFLGAENRFYLYGTNLHPNALGYHVMAAEFEAAISGNPQAPFYATNLCVRLTAAGDCEAPLAYKQNLMETGDLLYVDDDRQLSGSIPNALNEGRWIQTAHADRDLANADLLEFDLSVTATVYVAYDADATSLPDWLSNDFTATSLSINTTGTTGSELTLYRQDNVIGQVVLGGADAGQTGAAVNYLVVLVEN